MSSWLEVFGVDGIVVPAIPLHERLLGELVRLVVIPDKHGWAEGETDGLAILLDDGLRVVQQIVRIDDTDLYAIATYFVPISDSRTNEA